MKSENIVEKIKNALFVECECGECPKYKPKCDASISHVDMSYGEFIKLIDELVVAAWEEGNNSKATR